MDFLKKTFFSPECTYSITEVNSAASMNVLSIWIIQSSHRICIRAHFIYFWSKSMTRVHPFPPRAVLESWKWCWWEQLLWIRNTGVTNDSDMNISDFSRRGVCWKQKMSTAIACPKGLNIFCIIICLLIHNAHKILSVWLIVIYCFPDFQLSIFLLALYWNSCIFPSFLKKNIFTQYWALGSSHGGLIQPS